MHNPPASHLFKSGNVQDTKSMVIDGKIDSNRVKGNYIIASDTLMECLPVQCTICQSNAPFACSMHHPIFPYIPYNYTTPEHKHVHTKTRRSRN